MAQTELKTRIEAVQELRQQIRDDVREQAERLRDAKEQVSIERQLVIKVIGAAADLGITPDELAEDSGLSKSNVSSFIRSARSEEPVVDGEVSSNGEG